MMSRFSRILPLLTLLLASLACNLPGAVSAPPTPLPPQAIPTFTPVSTVEVKPTEPPPPPTFTAEPTALQPSAATFDPRQIPDCDIFVDADFPNTVGAIPDSKISASDSNQQACQYNFANGTLFVSIATSLPGREAYENVRQFDALSGGAIEPVSVGEIAIFKTFDDGRVTLEAVINGWYVTLTEQGFDRKHLLLLAELLQAHLLPYPSNP
jgi:hypothetical protein